LVSFDSKFDICVSVKSWHDLEYHDSILNQQFGVFTEFITMDNE